MSRRKEPPPQTVVALRYRTQEDTAPRIIASGRGEIAEQILALARGHDIPIYEESAVADALAKLEIGAEIPPAFYRVVAEILAFVYSMDQKLEDRS